MSQPGLVSLRGLSSLALLLAVAASCQTWPLGGREREIARLDALGRDAEAIPLARAAFAAAERRGRAGPIVRAGTELARLQLGAGDARASLELAERMATRAQAELGPRDPLLALAWSRLGEAQLYFSRNDEAESLHRRALELRESRFGAQSALLIDDLLALSEIAAVRGDAEQALPLAERALAIASRSYAADDARQSAPLRTLARAQQAAGEYAEGESTLQRSLAVLRGAKVADGRQLALVLMDLGAVRGKLGYWEKAGRDYDEALAVARQTLGGEHPLVAQILIGVASVYRAQSQTQKAGELRRQVFAQIEQHFGPEHPKVAGLLLALAQSEKDVGHLFASEQMVARARAILVKAYGPDHEAVASVDLQIAERLNYEGRVREAADLQSRAIARLARTRGPAHPSVASALIGLARYQRLLGEFDLAAQSYEHSRELMERAYYGPDHPNVAAVLQATSELYLDQGKRAEARALLERALAMRRRAGIDQDTKSAGLMNMLASIEEEFGNFERAEQWARQAVATFEHSTEPAYFGLVSGKRRLAEYAWRRGDLAEALAYYQQALGHADELLQTFLGAIGNDRKSSLLQALGQTVSVTSSVVAFHLGSGGQQPGAEDLAFRAIVSRKGRVFEAAADQWEKARQRANPEEAKLLEELRLLRGRLAAAAYQGGGSPRELQESELAQLERQRAQLEESLVTRLPVPTSESPTREQLAARIPDGALLLDFVRFGKPIFNGQQPIEEQNERYAVYVLSHSGQLRWRDLGPAEPIDRAVFELREHLAGPETPDLPAKARALDRLVFEPIADFTAGQRQLLVSPDGALSFVPFGALCDARGHYRIERFRFTYLDSSRDLLRLAKKGASAAPALVVGAPDFGARDVETANARAGERRSAARGQRSADFERRAFVPIPAAQDEVREVARLLGVRPMLGADASESVLKSAHSPRILHIATHAFFLDEPASGNAENSPAALQRGSSAPIRSSSGKVRSVSAPTGAPEQSLDNPLLRSGLVLAGANRRANGPDDGVLTGLEASALDLDGTELLVLSACETGLGEAHSADGVHGLRRAFALAGVRTQVMSLWKVNDEATRRLMAEYYRRLLRGEGRSEALRQVQLALLRDPVLSSPYYWAAFIVSGDWGPLEQLSARTDPPR